MMEHFSYAECTTSVVPFHEKTGNLLDQNIGAMFIALTYISKTICKTAVTITSKIQYF